MAALDAFEGVRRPPEELAAGAAGQTAGASAGEEKQWETRAANPARPADDRGYREERGVQPRANYKMAEKWYD